MGTHRFLACALLLGGHAAVDFANTLLPPPGLGVVSFWQPHFPSMFTGELPSGIVLPVGAIVGELGMLSPSNMRTQSLECVEAGLVLSVSYSKVEELYVQNPAFGFYFLRLVSARLFQNLETVQQQLAQQVAASAAGLKPA